MTFDPRHLAPGENPPSPLAQDLADNLPDWTTARTAPLPAGPASLTAVTQASYNKATHGSHWQRFVNTFALELQLAEQNLNSGLNERFLDLPGYTHASLDQIWEIDLPAADTVITAAAGNVNAKYLATSSSWGPVLDPNRTADITLQEVTRLYDFYYGLSAIQNYAAGGTSFTLPARAANIEWITANGVSVTGWTLQTDQLTVTFPVSVAGPVDIHYTTYDIFYEKVDDSKLYVRQPFFELFLTYTGTAPAGSSRVAGQASNVVIVQPRLTMVWNELDEIGLLLDRTRHLGELNADFQRRLLDTILFPSDATKRGLRNALATERGLVQHATWGPGGTLTAQTVTLGTGKVAAEDILVDRLPLPYYSIAPVSGQSTTLSFPALDPGVSSTQTLQLQATGGAVIPQVVPLSFTWNAPASALAVYDEIEVKYNSTQSFFSAPGLPWYAGTLQVFKNGTALAHGTDYTELSTTCFQLSTPATQGDRLQLAYVYDGGEDPPDLEAQADIETDLAPVLRAKVTLTVDPIAAESELFTGWIGVPANTDTATIPTNNTWTLSVTVTNAGSLASSACTIIVNLPPTLSYDGQHLSAAGPLAKQHDLRYIDGDQVWVAGLTDTAIQQQLYTARGAATPLLKALAREVTDVTPLLWGEIRWDQAVWRTLKERYSAFGFLPAALDADPGFTPKEVLGTGLLSGGSSPAVATVGSTVFGNASLGTTGYGYTVDLTKPGAAVASAPITRYAEFQSGIGQGDDCLASVASLADVQSDQNLVIPQQFALNNANVADALADLSEPSAWYVKLQCGTFYLNQEEHYLFANPIYVESTGTQIYLSGCRPFSAVRASRYDGSTLQPLRQVFFTDLFGNLTLTNGEALPVAADGLTLYAAYANINIVSSDHTLTSTTDDGAGALRLSSALTPGTVVNVTYTLANSFIVIGDVSGCYVILDQAYNPALVVYEGDGTAAIVDVPLHPYYNPRGSGFIYLRSDTYIPTNLSVWCDPQTVPADGLTSFNVKARVTDANGAGKAGLPVSILVNYREGAVTFNGVTDQFGYVTNNFTASSSVQVATVSAALQLFDAQGNPLPSLLDSTSVELYATYS